MKNVVLILSFFVLFEVGFADSGCKDEDITTITTCYNKFYGNISNPEWCLEMLMSLSIRNRKKEDWKLVCREKQILNECIGDDRIKRCFNIKDIKKLPLGDGVAKYYMSKVVIASFIQTDHICDNLFKLPEADYKCDNDVEQIVFDSCRNVTNNNKCKESEEFIKCTVKTTYNKCGKVVGCFERKNALLLQCTDPLSCHRCEDISATKNLIDGVCDEAGNGTEDQGYVDILSHKENRIALHPRQRQ